MHTYNKMNNLMLCGAHTESAAVNIFYNYYDTAFNIHPAFDKHTVFEFIIRYIAHTQAKNINNFFLLQSIHTFSCTF